jgi:hypothetical protein
VVQSSPGGVAFTATVDARGAVEAAGLALVTCAGDAEVGVADALAGADSFGSARDDADAECSAVPISRIAAAVAAACGAAAVTLRAATAAEFCTATSALFTRNALTVSRRRPA